MIVSVTDLSSYLFCQRKLYARKALGIVEPVNQAMVLGTLRHATHDTIGKLQEVLVRQISRDTTAEELAALFSKNYMKALKHTIISHKQALQELDLAPGDIFVDVWPFIQEEAQVNAREIHVRAGELDKYGEQLWEVMPKSISEYHVTSPTLELKGIIDRIDVTDGTYIPYELKTGRPPREGVWPGHRIQVGAYELMLQEAFHTEVNEGYVRYLDQRLDRPVVMNPFLEDDVKKLVRSVQALLEAGKLPEPCGKKICNCADIPTEQK